MKKTAVYRREYKKSEEEGYFDLIKKIKENSFDNSSPKDYITFDGIFLSRISIELLSGSCGSLISNATAVIEKMGPDLTKKSAIETLLLKEGFKKEPQSKE